MLLQSVLDRGASTWSENIRLDLLRKGFAEECYFTFSYSPIREESGGIGGVLCVVAETTQQVIAVYRSVTTHRGRQPDLLGAPNAVP